MATKLLIFDCDGVVRSIPFIAIFRAYKAICEFLGLNYLSFFPNIRKFEQWYDNNWKRNIDRLGVDTNDSSALSQINDVFHKTFDQYAKLFYWVNPYFKFLSNRVSICICSTSTSRSVKQALSNIEVIPKIIGCDDVELLKPHPEGIEILLKYFDVSPRNTWMIGDANVDIQAGKAAGTRTAIVTWGISKSDEIAKSGADKVLNNQRDILKLL